MGLAAPVWSEPAASRARAAPSSSGPAARRPWRYHGHRRQGDRRRHRNGRDRQHGGDHRHGRQATGGVTGTGGTPATGGVTGTGGRATGGVTGTGGVPATGGSPERAASPEPAGSSARGDYRHRWHARDGRHDGRRRAAGATGTGPCAGLCSGPTAVAPGANSGGLETAATCQEVVGTVMHMVCGNFVAPRTFTANGTAIDCAHRRNFSCRRRRTAATDEAGAGNQSYAYYTTF